MLSIPREIGITAAFKQAAGRPEISGTELDLLDTTVFQRFDGRPQDLASYSQGCGKTRISICPALFLQQMVTRSFSFPLFSHVFHAFPFDSSSNAMRPACVCSHGIAMKRI
ncbi:hypothetical protein [Marinobacterium maritimum]|uniref:hypothetical protein n=1 Tax=Marinobacterium maritimum TaxID=500162 RepID=UPI0031CEC659